MRIISCWFLWMLLLVGKASAQEQIIYNNDFNTELDKGWNIKCGYFIENGKLILNPDLIHMGFDSSRISREIKIDHSRNFEILTSISIYKQVDGRLVGIVLFSNEKYFKRYDLSFYSFNSPYFSKYTTEKGFKNYQKEKNFKYYSSNIQNSYLFKIQKIGKIYSIYLDDILVFQENNLEIFGEKFAFEVDQKQSLAINYLKVKYLPQDYDPSKSSLEIEVVKEKAEEYIDKKDFVRANNYLTDLISIDSTKSILYHLRAISKTAEGKKEAALLDFNKTLELTRIEEKDHILFERGKLYVSQGKLDLALNDFAESEKLNPNNRLLYLTRGNVYLKQNSNEQAIVDLSKAIQLSPKHYHEAVSGRILAYKAKGDYESAIADAKSCLEVNPKLKDSYLDLVTLFIRNNDFNKAKEYYQKSLDTSVTEQVFFIKWKYYQYYAIAAGENIPNGDYDLALQQINKGLVEYGSPVRDDSKLDYANMLSLKGMILAKLNLKSEAVQVYKQSLSIVSPQPEVSKAILVIGSGKSIPNVSPTIVAETDKKAPTINISSPLVTRGLTIVHKNKSIAVSGKAIDESGIYEVVINGVDATVDSLGNFLANVPLAMGENKLIVKATDTKMNAGIVEFSISRQASDLKNNVQIENPIIPINNSVVTPEGKYYALIIGVKDYKDPTINSLDMPIKDANSIYQTLITDYTFNKQDALFLKNPTRDELFDALEQLSKKVTSLDNLLIFYAGHGYWDENRKQGYWFPSDAKKLNRSSWITNADLKEYISAIQSKHTLLISDACFSGGIFKSRNAMDGANRAIKELYELPSRKAMTSGTLKEVPDQSVFIEYLVKRLKQNTEKYLSAEQLYSNLRIAVINNSANGQVPQFGEIKESGDEGGDFIFIKK